MELNDGQNDPHQTDTPTKGVIVRLRASYRSLSDAEQQVARFVEKSPAETIRLPIKRLAEQIGVSEASIIRFSRSIGFQGVRDLKLALAAESTSPYQLINEDIQPTDSVLSVAQKVLHSDMQAIADAIEMLNERELDRAVETILSAPRIECYGIGSSMPVALDAYYRFSRIGLPVTMVTDPHMQSVSASRLPPGSVAFAISHTGRTKETLDALYQAKASGATCILLTSYAQTPLGRFADIVLVTGARETAFRTEAVASRIAHLSVIDALYVALAMRRFDQSINFLEQANGIIEEHRLGERSHLRHELDHED